MHAATGRPNIEMGGTDFKWGLRAPLPPRWRRPWLDGFCTIMSMFRCAHFFNLIRLCVSSIKFMYVVLFPIYAPHSTTPVVLKVFLTTYHLWDPYRHHIPPCSRKSQIYQVSFDQKFGNPGLTQMRQKDNGCEKL